MIQRTKALSTILVASFIFIFSHSFAAEEKIKIEKFKDWGLQCPKPNICEVIQSIQIKDSNLKFNLIYSSFRNKDKQEREILSIVTPLGVNVQSNLLLKFIEPGKKEAVGKEVKQTYKTLASYGIPYLKCEVIGCIVSINNDTNNKDHNENFKRIKEGLIKHNSFQIIIQGFAKPIMINSSLAGFGNAYDEMKKRNKS